jgi:hypothetical protein
MHGQFECVSQVHHIIYKRMEGISLFFASHVRSSFVSYKFEEDVGCFTFCSSQCTIKVSIASHLFNKEWFVFMFFAS